MTWHEEAASGLGALDDVKDLGLFGGLSDEVLRTLLGGLSLLELDAGDVVFREGDLGREMYVCLRGEMEIVKRSKSERPARVAMLGPGDWFGEMAILDVMPRSATVTVLAPSKLLRLRATDIEALYRRDPRSYALFVLNLAREMSRRLRTADGIVAELAAQNDPGPLDR